MGDASERAAFRDLAEAMVKQATEPLVMVPQSELEALEAVARLLPEVMEWIKNWDPSFTFDDEWPGVAAQVDAALDHLSTIRREAGE